MFLHFEDGVVLYETPSVLDIKDDFLATQARSKAVSLEQCRAIPWYRRFFRALLRVFAPLL
jgi:cardiolipin synthase